MSQVLSLIVGDWNHSYESRDWVSAAEALAHAKESLGDIEGETAIYNHLCNGLIRACASRTHARWRKLSSAKGIESLDRLETLLMVHSVSTSRFISEQCVLLPSFWSRRVKSSKRWEGSLSIPFIFGHWVDWERSEFAYIFSQSSFDDFDEDEDIYAGFVGCIKAYGVRFLMSDVEAVFPRKPKGPQKHHVGRHEKFDWARAVAAVSAMQLKHEFVADLYAHGAQAAIAEAMARWFQLNDVEPSETALKQKAAMVLGEWQREDRNPISAL